MTSKEKIDKIIQMRFKEHMRPSDIAKKLGVSKPYITKIIKTDKRYFKERVKQKKLNKKKNREETKLIIYTKRELEKQQYEFMKWQHIKAVIELSLDKRDNSVGKGDKIKNLNRLPRANLLVR